LTEREEGVDRLLTLSDGIFAIAMTLLVLDVSVPEGLTHAGFTEALHQTWPRLGAYALSFAVISGVWRDHHRIFRLVRRADARVVHLTLALLAMVALLPYPTSLLADYGGSEPLAVTVYATVAAVDNLLLLALFLTIRRSATLRRHPIEAPVVRGTVADFVGTVLIAGASIVVAFAVSAGAGLLTWLAAIPVGFAAGRLQRPATGRALT
jgi:uncharacterized membrane protein